MPRSRKHHAFIVTWRDSASLRGWRAIDDARHMPSTITSVGWLAKENKREITITTSISDCGNVVDALTIPREAVVKMTRLRNYVAGNIR